MSAITIPHGVGNTNISCFRATLSVLPVVSIFVGIYNLKDHYFPPTVDSVHDQLQNKIRKLQAEIDVHAQDSKAFYEELTQFDKRQKEADAFIKDHDATNLTVEQRAAEAIEHLRIMHFIEKKFAPDTLTSMEKDHDRLNKKSIQIENEQKEVPSLLKEYEKYVNRHSGTFVVYSLCGIIGSLLTVVSVIVLLAFGIIPTLAAIISGGLSLIAAASYFYINHRIRKDRVT